MTSDLIVGGSVLGTGKAAFGRSRVEGPSSPAGLPRDVRESGHTGRILETCAVGCSLALALLMIVVAPDQVTLLVSLAWVLLAVFVGYCLPTRRAVWQVAGMIGAYCVVAALRPMLISPVDVFGMAGVLIIVTGVVTALSSSEHRYRLLVASSSDAILALDPDGMVTWASPGAASTCGWGPYELLGTPVDHLIHPGDRMLLADSPARPVGGMDQPIGAAPLVVRVRTQSGEYRWMSISVVSAPAHRHGPPVRVATFKDVDELVAAREAAWEERCRLHATLNALLDPHVLLEPRRDEGGRIVDFTVVDANAAACTFNRLTFPDLVGSRLLNLFPGLVVADLLEAYVEVMRSGIPVTLDDWKSPGRVDKYFDIRAVRVDGCISQTWRDVTDRHTAAHSLAVSEEQYRLLAENTLDVIVRVREDTFLWVSPSITEALGWTPAELVGRDIHEVVHAADVAALANAIEALRTGRTAVFRVRALAKDLAYHWVECHAKPYRDSSGREAGVVATLRTVDIEVAAEQRLDWQAHHDELTGLLNRNAAMDLIGEFSEHDHRLPGKDIAVLFCDVDSFKAINDSYGHAVGDQVLKVIADRVSATVRSCDLVARVGGDELLITLAGVHGIDEAIEKAEVIRRCVAQPIRTAAGDVCATLSIGVALAPTGEGVDESIARADEALYRAKQSGEGCVAARAQKGSKVPS